MRRRRTVFVFLTAAAAWLLLLTAAPAFAEPTTPVTYPSGVHTTRFNGYAFDTCDAPTVTAMRAWESSPYDAVGVYVGGPNRTCGQANLTADWVSQVTARGWRLVPIYMGLQAPCTFRPNSVEIDPAQASAQGTASAQDAIARAKALGMTAGSGIYGDMENYDATDMSCRTTVLRYLSAWTKELHRQGFVSGVYAGLYSGARHLSDYYTSTGYARPDALWIARWDGSAALTGWSGISNAKWANHQRAKQYRGDHNETHGGVTINIDSDRFDGPVASVTFDYHVTADPTLYVRSGPATSYPVVGSYQYGASIEVVCQAAGSKVHDTTVWNKLSDGSYASDHYVDTPSQTTYSAPLPKCRYPYQTTASSLTERRGPGTSYSAVKSLPNGSLAWLMCQRAGTKVGTTSVWDRLDDGYYVTDYYVATGSNTTYTPPVPRC